MTTSQSFINFPPPCSKRSSEQGRNSVADLESQAQLVEKLIPKFKGDHDRQSIVKSYRAIEPWLVTYCEKHCLTTGPIQRGICGHVGCDSCDCCWDDPADRIQREPCL